VPIKNNITTSTLHGLLIIFGGNKLVLFARMNEYFYIYTKIHQLNLIG